jgi:hypothetical protein
MRFRSSGRNRHSVNRSRALVRLDRRGNRRLAHAGHMPSGTRALRQPDRSFSATLRHVNSGLFSLEFAAFHGKGIGAGPSAMPRGTPLGAAHACAMTAVQFTHSAGVSKMLRSAARARPPSMRARGCSTLKPNSSIGLPPKRGLKRGSQWRFPQAAYRAFVAEAVIGEELDHSPSPPAPARSAPPQVKRKRPQWGAFCLDDLEADSVSEPDPEVS